MPICPECDTDLDLDEEELDEGEIVSCPECGSDFEVITKHPLELNPVDELDEDEDEDEDDEEDNEGEYKSALEPERGRVSGNLCAFGAPPFWRSCKQGQAEKRKALRSDLRHCLWAECPASLWCENHYPN